MHNKSQKRGVILWAECLANSDQNPGCTPHFHTASRKPLVWPSNFVDVTAEKTGTVIGIGAEGTADP
jgi:hypothetical protein